MEEIFDELFRAQALNELCMHALKDMNVYDNLCILTGLEQLGKMLENLQVKLEKISHAAA